MSFPLIDADELMALRPAAACCANDCIAVNRAWTLACTEAMSLRRFASAAD
ncbi:hypothetical protein D3C86_2258500 [compost metagenome]